MLVKKGRLYSILVTSIVFVCTASGCWDRVEPEERGFVVAAAIDEPAEKESGMYKITYQFVNAGKMGAGSGGKSGSGSNTNTGDKPFYNLSGTANTVDEFNQEIDTRTSRTPFFQHMMLIVVSDKIAKKPKKYADIFDFFISNEQMRLTNKIFIAEGEASKVLDIQHPSEQLPALYLRSISENTKFSNRMLPPTIIGDIQMFLLKKESYAIQKITASQNEAKVDGSAIFSGKKGNLSGYLNAKDTEGLNLIIGKLRMGVVPTNLGKDRVNFKIYGMKSSIKPIWEDDRNIRFHVLIEAEGDVTEKYGKIDLSKPQTIRRIERNAEKEMNNMAMRTIDKLQNTFHSDAAGFGTELRQKYYRRWQQIKDDWDGENGYFAASKITVQSKVKIRRTGLANKTE